MLANPGLSNAKCLSSPMPGYRTKYRCRGIAWPSKSTLYKNAGLLHSTDHWSHQARRAFEPSVQSLLKASSIASFRLRRYCLSPVFSWGRPAAGSRYEARICGCSSGVLSSCTSWLLSSRLASEILRLQLQTKIGQNESVRQVRRKSDDHAPF